MLSDISEIIPLRWNYFKDNWEFIKGHLADKIANYEFSDLLELHIRKLSEFIEAQRNSQNQAINPFANSTSTLQLYFAVFDNIEIGSIWDTLPDVFFAYSRKHIMVLGRGPLYYGKVNICPYINGKPIFNVSIPRH